MVSAIERKYVADDVVFRHRIQGILYKLSQTMHAQHASGQMGTYAAACLIDGDRCAQIAAAAVSGAVDNAANLSDEDIESALLVLYPLCAAAYALR